MKKQFMFSMMLLSFLIFITIPANAIPVLQLYIEGAEYDSETESWVWAPTNGDGPTLWVIGNISGPGGHGDLTDVRLAAAYDSSLTPAITLSPTTTGGFGGFSDPSVPGLPSVYGLYTGVAPELSDRRSLPPHGVYGPGTSFMEFGLGNFTLTDSPVADFIDSFPTTLFPDAGQINAYDVSITGTDWVHFDAYGSIARNPHGSRPVFAPFSHDATAVPEPATLLLVGSGLAMLWLFGRKRFKAVR